MPRGRRRFDVWAIWELMTAAIEQGRKYATRHTEADVHVSMRDRDTQICCMIQSLKPALADIVTDSGSGLPAGTIEKAMRPFRERQEQQGFGMGLTLANAIIEIMVVRWRFRVCSIRGRRSPSVCLWRK